MRREFALPATVPQQVLDALVNVAEAAEELKLWEPGRRGYAAAQECVFTALARLAAAREQAKETG